MKVANMAYKEKTNPRSTFSHQFALYFPTRPDSSDTVAEQQTATPLIWLFVYALAVKRCFCVAQLYFSATCIFANISTHTCTCTTPIGRECLRKEILKERYINPQNSNRLTDCLIV